METTTLKPLISIPSSHNIQYEWRMETCRKGLPQLMETPNQQYVFRSLYGYDRNVAAQINKNGNTKGLKGLPVYSGMLIIDCDTDEQAEAAGQRLSELEVLHEIWETGNRGRHFHIPIVPMYGTNVVWSQKMWLQDSGLWDTVDRSIYIECGQIRVPGAPHLKTGRIKRQLLSVPGNLLEIPIRVPPPSTRATPVVVESVESRMEFYRNLFYRRGTGSRYPHLYILWQRGLAAGETHEEILESLLWWNEHFANPPHCPSYITSKVKGFR